MGRILLLALVILAVWLVWRAFGPGSQSRIDAARNPQPPAIKGPDDDEEFLWTIEKNRFKERRERERREQERRERDSLDDDNPTDPPTSN